MEEISFSALTPLHIVLAADIPPSPGNIPTTHPLMVRHADHSSLTLGSGSSTTRLTQGIGRSQRTLRQLTANTGHTIHVHYPGNRQPNPPLILQRWVKKIIGLTRLQHCLELGEAVHYLTLLSYTQIKYLSHFFVDYTCNLSGTTKLYNMFFCLSALRIYSAIIKQLMSSA